MGNICKKFFILSSKDTPDALPSLISHKKINSWPTIYSRSLSRKPLNIKMNEIISTPLEPIIEQEESSDRLPQYRKPIIIDNYLVIWLTSNVDDDQNSINHLQQIVPSFRLFTDIDEFFAFILQIKDEKIFLILSDIIAPKIVSFIHKMSQVISIYIISKDRLTDEESIKQYRKIKGTFTDIEPICEMIKRKIYLSKNDILPIENLNSSSIIIEYLIKNILLYEIEYQEKSKQVFIDYARQQYPNELNVIEEFEQNYTPSTSVWWYTRKCFIYSIFNEAFRTQNIEMMIKMGFFIRDLHQQIDLLYKETDNQSTMIVYRGQGILENELEIIKNNKNGFLSFKNFLWIDTNRTISLSFARLARNNPDLTGILFRIEINSIIPYILLEKLSYDLNSATELLFSIYLVFRIGEIKQIEDNIWEIDLILINDNDQQLKDILLPIEVDFEEQKAWQQLGSYYIENNQFDKAEELFKTLIESNSIQDPEKLALLNEHLGFISNRMNDSIKSLLHYKQSLKYYLTFLPSNDSSLFSIYLSIGILCRQQKNLNGAIKHFKHALNIALDSSQRDYLQIANLYHYTAEIYAAEGMHIEAIQNYQSALESQLNNFPLQNISVAITYNKIGETFQQMEDYTTALSYYDKTLTIQKKSLEPNDCILAVTNYNIAKVLDGLKQYKEAIEYVSQALNIARHTFGPNHESVQLYKDYLNRLRRKTLIGVIPNGAVYE